MKPEKHLDELKKGLKAPLKSKKLLASTILISLLSFTLLMLGSDPQYTIQILSFNILYLGEAVTTLASNTLRMSGIIGMMLLVAYSVLIGVSLTNFAEKIRVTGVKDFGNLAGFLPGFAVAGCAGCGVGLLSFIGLAGIFASLPFNGNLVRIAGVFLMLGLIANTGDPKTCSIDAS